MRLGRSSTKPQRSATVAPGRTPPADEGPSAAWSPGPASTSGPPLGQLLVRQRAITEALLVEALEQQPLVGRPIGSLLVQLGLIGEHQLAAALAEQLNLPLADLSRYAPDPDAARELPESAARSLTAVPVTVDEDGVLDVAISDPSPDVLAGLEQLGRPVRVHIATEQQVMRAINSMYRALRDVEQQVAAFVPTAQPRGVVQRADLDLTADADAPVVNVANMILTQALRDRASDVHIEPQDTMVRVRFRIDGALHDTLTLPTDMGPALASRIKILAGMNIVERRRPQDGQLATTIDGRAVDIRVATMGTVWGEKVVLRILDKSRPMYRLRDLGMPDRTHDAFAKMIRSPYGMVICAGPTGSGKTTTLYASMTEVNGVDRNVTTIEDPVEYVFPSINQIQINEQAGITFAAGLRSILRQDPDMILVGEMRDVETARIAVQSALTGHFVLSSLHATDAVSALYRFLDMGIEAFLVASSVIGVVGQRLVRRSCLYCRAEYMPSTEELAFYAGAGGDPDQTFYAGTGCNYCSGTGFSDRIGVYELLSVTEEMRELLVADHPSHERMRLLAIEQGMSPLRAEGVRLVAENETTITEILRTIYTL
ncbi:MAG TPA: GspE/PulE family protein [Kineosporiaceae bacterium]